MKICLVILLAITTATYSVEVVKNSTESIGFQIDETDEEYPSDSYYYDNYENGHLELTDSNEKTKIKSIKNNTKQSDQLLVVKQLENSLNEIKPPASNATYDYVATSDDDLDEESEITAGENTNNNETGDETDVSDVIIINAEQQDNEYQLDKSDDKLIKTTNTPDYVEQQIESDENQNEDENINKIETNDYNQSDLDLKAKTKEANHRNYLTFLFIFISIGVALTGLTIVTILFVKRRSLLLKSKCQIVSKTKGQNYTTVGQTDY